MHKSYDQATVSSSIWKQTSLSATLLCLQKWYVHSNVPYALAHELPTKYRAKLLTSKEIARIKNNNIIIADNPLVNSSYSKIYYEFKEIFDSIMVISDTVQNSILKVRSNLLSENKNNTPTVIINSICRREIYDYKNDGFIIFATDA